MSTPTMNTPPQTDTSSQTPAPGSPANDERWKTLVQQLPQMPPELAINLLIERAIESQASDIFIASAADGVSVSYRLLGIVNQATVLPLELGHRCMTHIRAASGLRFSEKLHPQDGRWEFKRSNGKTVDLRLSILPTLYGESIAIRILERESDLRYLKHLGFVGPQLNQMSGLLYNPSGLILVTGPTGVGKTTTVYACLHHLNDGSRKIHTIEDPIEYSVPGLQQTQVDIRSKVDFDEVLRSVIRQGPDVIMIGEIRDRETADLTLRASASGQLVFATLHAPVASATIQSLLTMGISPFLLGASILAVVGQRLIRVLNPETRMGVDLSKAPRTFEEVQQYLKPGEGKMVFAAKDSDDPRHGFIGRTGLFEILPFTPTIRKMISDLKPGSTIAQQAIQEGMLDFRRAGLMKVAQGVTSFDEINRVVPSGNLWVDDLPL